MRKLRYAINVTLDGCCHHESGLPPDAESMAYWTEVVANADALLYGRVTYEMMESAWRKPASGVWPNWMSEHDIPFANAIDNAKKYVVSGTLTEADWDTELLDSNLEPAVSRLKDQSSGYISVGGVSLPAALARLGLIDQYDFLVHPVVAGRGPKLLDGLSEQIELDLMERREFRSGLVLHRYVPK